MEIITETMNLQYQQITIHTLKTRILYIYTKRSNEDNEIRTTLGNMQRINHKINLNMKKGY